jgi:hypothetical protein
MKKAYHPSTKVVFGWAGSYFVIGGALLAAVWQGRLSWNEAGLLVAVLIVSLVAVYLFLKSRGPWLRIQDTRIETKRSLGGRAIVDDVRDYSLVISTDWIAFRRNDQQDIMVNEATFDAEVWKELLNDLKNMPFKAII